MNRFLIPALLPAAVLPLLVDASLKGVALLALAVVCALAMRGASAAARHMVWLGAIIALLLLPFLAGMLPGWRVLPEWAVVQPVREKEAAVKAKAALSIGIPPASLQEAPGAVTPVAASSPSVPAPGPLAPASEPPADLAPPPAEVADAPEEESVERASTFNTGWISTVWLPGCGVLLLRLAAAHWLLRRAAARCEVVSGGRLAEALAAARRECGVTRAVRLLVDEQRSIPVVWGIFRPQLLLPADACTWDEGQLRSVLLHELAHIRRRDTAVQALTGIACALYWFNPLVWVAAWRLHVERERACDDLVLTHGVRPSEYAGHLLHVAAEHTAARWTAVCGLAMARKSSLEGRLLAVLSDKLNRRSLTRALTVAAVVLSTAIAIPVAMLRAQAPASNPPAADTAAPSTAGEKSEDTRSKEVTVTVTVSKLEARVAERLQWGETVNGLRAALVRPRALGEPAAKEIFDFKLVVQNVSKAPIQVSSASATANTRYLKLWDASGILSAHHDKEAPAVNFTLQPGEAATMRLFKYVTEGDSISGNLGLTFVGEFNIEKAAPASGWSGKLVTAKTAAMATGHGLLPKDEESRELFKVWCATARRNEQIPGAFIGLLAEGINKFIELNPNWTTVPQLLKLRERCDATHDWDGLEALALLDEIAAVQTAPAGHALMAETSRMIRTGKPLPKELEKAPWGEPRPNGLRLAWLFGSGAKEYPIGTALAARALIHNAGKEAVVFLANTWTQASHSATDGNSAKIKDTALSHLTLSSLVTCRLAPGEYMEVDTPGIGLGKHETVKHKEGERASGTYFEVSEGDTVTVTTGPLALCSEIGKTEPDPGTAELWWLEFIEARLKRDLPLPADAKARRYILYHAAMDLFGTPVSEEINASFEANQSPTAIEALAKRLASRPGLTPFAGTLQSGATTFKVTAPAAAPGPASDSPKRDTSEKPRSVSADVPMTLPPAATAPPVSDAAEPKQKTAQLLHKEWQRRARADGKIPGACIALLAESVTTFIKANPTWATTPQLEEMLPRLNGSHDWPNPEAVALLDELAALQDTPVSMAVEKEQDRTIQTGQPLPQALEKAPWGERRRGGLRAAYLAEPQAGEYSLGAVLKGRILIHNAGTEPVVFRTRNWHQLGHKASDAKGAEINVNAISWLTRGRLTAYRLAPGEFVELYTAGLGVGPMKNDQEPGDARAGSWIEAKEGDAVTVTTGTVPLHDWNDEIKPGQESAWWLDFIKASLQSNLPLPADQKGREQFLSRVAMDLFGTPVSEEMSAAFVADQTPAALDNLAKSLAARPGQIATSGDLPCGVMKFRVKAAKSAGGGDSAPGAKTAAAAALKKQALQPALLRISNDKYSAIAVQSGEEMHFVIVYQGRMSDDIMQTLFSMGRSSGVDPRNPPGGLEASVDGPRKPYQEPDAPPAWGFKGQVFLSGAPKGGGQRSGAPGRAISVDYGAENPNVVVLGGKAFALGRSIRIDEVHFNPGRGDDKFGFIELIDQTSTAGTGAANVIMVSGDADAVAGTVRMSGRIFVLRDSGEVLQTDRTLPLRNEQDLVTIGDFAMHDAHLAEYYANSRRVQAMSGWVLGWDQQNPQQHGDGQRVAKLRLFADGRALWLPDGRTLTERKLSPAKVQELLQWLDGEGQAGESKPAIVTASGITVVSDPLLNTWDRETQILSFTLNGKRHGLTVETGSPEDEVSRKVWDHLREVIEQARPVVMRHWSEGFQTLAKDVAASRGLTDWIMDDVIAWGPDEDGLRSGMLISSKAVLHKTTPVQLVIRNVSAETKELRLCTSLNRHEPAVRAMDGTRLETSKVILLGTDAVFKITLKPGEQHEFAGPGVQFGMSKDATGKLKTPDWPVCGVDTGAGQVKVKFPLQNLPGPETGEATVAVAGE